MITLRSPAWKTWLLLMAALLMPVSQVHAQGGRGGSNPFGGGGGNKGGFGGGGSGFGGGGNKGFGGGGGNPFGGGSSNKSFGGGGNNFGGGGNKGFGGGGNKSFGGGGSGGNKGFGGGGSGFGGGNSNKSFGGGGNNFGGNSNKGFGGSGSNKGFGGGNNNFGGNSNKGFGGGSAPKSPGGNANRGGKNPFGGGSGNNFGGGGTNFGGNRTPSGNSRPGSGALGGSRPGGGNSKGTLGGLGGPNKGNPGSSNFGGGRGNSGGMSKPPGTGNRPPGGITKTPGSIDRKPGSITKTPGGIDRKPGSITKTPGGNDRKPGSITKTPSSIDRKPGSITKTPGGIGSVGGKGSQGTKGSLSDLRKPGGNNNPLGGKGNPLDKKSPGSIKGGPGGPFSPGGMVGGKNRPGDSAKPGGTPNFVKTREGKKQWLSDIAKQGPNVRVGDKVKQSGSPFGRSTKRPGGLLAKSDLGIASKTALQAQGLPLGKGGSNFKPGAAGFFGAGKPGLLGGPGGPGIAGGPGIVGGPGIAVGEPVPGAPIGGGGLINNNAFQGEAITAAILTGIVVAASLAQDNHWCDAYDDHWVGPGGGFVNYVVVDDCYVYEGYNDGTYVDYGPPSSVVVNPAPGEAPPAGDIAQTPAAAGANELPFTPDGGDDAAVAETTPPAPSGETPGTEAPAPVVDATAPHVVAKPQVPGGVAPPTGPAKNPLPNQVTVADRKVAKKIASEIDALLAGEVGAIREQLAASLLSDEAREEFLKQHVTAEMDAAIVQELKNGMIDLNAEAVENAAKKLNLSTEVVGTLVPRVKLTRAVNDLQKLVKEEYSTENINAFSRRFENSLGEFGLSQALREGLAASTTAVLDSLRIRLSLDEVPGQASGQLVDAPQGEVPVLYFPPLAPAGKVYLLGGSTLGVGTATPGTLVVGRSEVRELMGVPHLDDAPIEAISVEKATNAPHDGTVLLNPSKLETTIEYTINGSPFTIGPGQSQHLPAGTAWVIKLDRGNGTQAHYTLSEGAYTFTNTDGVRDVTSLPCDVTIENPSLTGRFNLVVDQEAVSIPPGQALTLSSTYPIVVAFDRGTGADPVYKRLTRGTVAAGISSSDGGWDLFEIEPVALDGPEQASSDTPISVE